MLMDNVGFVFPIENATLDVNVDYNVDGSVVLTGKLTRHVNQWIEYTIEEYVEIVETPTLFEEFCGITMEKKITKRINKMKKKANSYFEKQEEIRQANRRQPRKVGFFDKMAVALVSIFK